MDTTVLTGQPTEQPTRLKRSRSSETHTDDNDKVEEPKTKKSRQVSFDVSVTDSTTVNPRYYTTGSKPGTRCEDPRTEARVRATEIATVEALKTAQQDRQEVEADNSTPWTPPGSPRPDGCSCS